MDWRDKLDPTIKEHFNELIKKVHNEKEAYTSATNISQAQLWCALAVLMKEVSNVQLQINSLKKQNKVSNKEKVKKNMEKF